VGVVVVIIPRSQYNQHMAEEEVAEAEDTERERASIIIVSDFV